MPTGFNSDELVGEELQAWNREVEQQLKLLKVAQYYGWIKVIVDTRNIFQQSDGGYICAAKFNSDELVSEELQEWSRLTEQHLQLLKDYQYDGGINVIVDTQNIFQQGDSGYICAAKTRALLQYLNDKARNSLKLEVTFKNASYLSDDVASRLIDELDKLTTIQYLFTDTKRDKRNRQQQDVVTIDESNEFDRRLSEIEGRNRLMFYYLIEPDEDKNPWLQLWEARLSDPSLNQDADYSRRELSLYSNGNSFRTKVHEINAAVDQAGAKLFEGLLLTLTAKERVIKSNPAVFLYETLVLGNIDKRTDLNTLTSCIKLLTDHLEKGQLFLFSAIEVNAPFDFLVENIELFKQLFAVLAQNYPKFNNFKFSTASDNCIDDSQLTEIYSSLKSVFSVKHICFTFEIHQPRRHVYNTEKNELENIFASNQRHRNISNREQGRASVADNPQPAIGAVSSACLTTQSSQRVSQNLRPFKLAGYRYQSDIQCEMTRENHVENQRETQLQQEVQQEIQINFQQQNQIADGADLGFNDRGINRENFVDDAHRYLDIIMNACLCDGEFNSYVSHNIHAITGIIWDHAISQHSLAHSIRYLSRSAIAQLICNPSCFAEGLSIDNLPTGFYLYECNVDYDLVNEPHSDWKSEVSYCD